jgi:uncharacterized protein (UPF0261 family)
MLVRLGAESDIAILVIEQNIGVATSVSENVAIMVNGRINRIVESRRLAADRDLQQRLLGVGRHSDAEPDPERPAAQGATRPVSPPAQRPGVAPVKIYVSNPSPPTRWSQPVSNAKVESSARTASVGATRLEEAAERRAPTSVTQSGPPTVLVVGTLDTKGPELRFIRDIVAGSGLRTRLVDVSTSGQLATCDVTAQEVALNHGRGGSSVFGRERGASVAAMAEAFEAFVRRQSEIVGIISAGGSGGASIVAPAMRALSIGTPKVLISSVASGDVGRYVGPSDITMMYSVTDVQGLNRISRQVLANGAQALVGMVKARLEERKTAGRARSVAERPAVGLTMFGVPTPCVRQVAKALEGDWECLVFHATGVGGRSMEKLIDSGLLSGVVDITTTEVADMLVGGVFPADEDRFGAVIRTRTPYVGSVGALDMVNFGAPETAPAAYKGRLMHAHNPQVTLMRTTREENDRMGRWIGERLNRMDGPVRFLLPELGVSALDAVGEPFWDPDADAALFKALEQTVRQSANRQLVRVRRNINEPEFAAAVVEAFRALHGQAGGRRRAAR